MTDCDCGRINMTCFIRLPLLSLRISCISYSGTVKSLPYVITQLVTEPTVTLVRLLGHTRMYIVLSNKERRSKVKQLTKIQHERNTSVCNIPARGNWNQVCIFKVHESIYKLALENVSKNLSYKLPETNVLAKVAVEDLVPLT